VGNPPDTLAAESGSSSRPNGLWPRIANLIGGPGQAHGVWNNVRLWQGASAGAVAVAAAAFGVIVAASKPAPPIVAPAGAGPAAAEVAVISDPTTKQPRFVATLDHATDKLILTPVAMKMPTGRDAELWIIPDGQKPISLGVIPQDAPKRASPYPPA
jgi:anti-sigma-K factor RskA